MSVHKLALLTICGCLVLNACLPATAAATPGQGALPAPTPTNTTGSSPTAGGRPFRVIAYATESVVIDDIPFKQLTHINFAFLIPNADGSFAPLPNTGMLTTLAQRSHENGVKLLISIGGWGWDKQFEEIAASPQKRSLFISGALKVLADYDLDGVDIDWEYPKPGQSAQNYLALMRELRAALTGKLLSSAVVSYGDENGLGIPTETFALLDFINVMTYDEPGHATLEQFQKGLDYWLGRGVPPEKLVMGIPFYSRPGEVPFRALAQNNPSAAQSDVFSYNGQQERYNGIPTVQKKTLLALQKAGGIMFWTLEQDAGGDLSLLNAISRTIAGYKP